jgi:hypothetical protein
MDNLQINIYCNKFVNYFLMQTFTPLNGSFTKKGNYVWGGGLTLSWKQLIQDIIK